MIKVKKVWKSVLNLKVTKSTHSLFVSAIGHKTTLYNVELSGDPNEGFDPAKEEGDEQYLIKWKNWSHIHNTWESADSLEAQKVNGRKKVENLKKREAEIQEWWVLSGRNNLPIESFMLSPVWVKWVDCTFID